MTPFQQHKGVVVPLIRSNIDTDAIIPSREMKRVSKSGLGEGLFASWRYADIASRTPSADFVLNEPRFSGASILLAGPNFGCGSSREHAVWALQEFGFRAILAPGFGAIFERNCYNNGLLPVQLDQSAIERIATACGHDPQTDQLLIDLNRQLVALPDKSTIPFHTPDVQRQMLLNGWDPIDRTLQLQTEIDNFGIRDRAARPWAWQVRRHSGLTE